MDTTLTTTPTGTLIGLIEQAALELAHRPPPESGVTALEWAEALGRTLDLTESFIACLTGRVEASGAHKAYGYPSPTAWLRGRLGTRQGRATERVTLSRQLPRLPRVAKLLADGQLSAGFAAVIADAVTRLDDEDTLVAEDILLGMVEKGCDVGQVDKAGKRITDLIQERRGQEPEPRDTRHGFKGSWIQHSKSLDGGAWVRGWFTPEHAAAFDEIIGPIAKPKAKGDNRDLAQRTADALMAVITEGNKGAGVTIILDLAAYLAATGDTGPTTNPTTNGQDPLTTDADTDSESEIDTDTEIDSETDTTSASDASVTGADNGCAQGSDAASAPSSSLTGAGTGTGTGIGGGAGTGSGAERLASVRGGLGWRLGAGRVPARLLDGTPISAAQARRIALSGGINPLLLGTASTPLELGRTVRFASGAQRKVLLAIHETCVVYGCKVPAKLCEIHHLEGGWKLGTPTNVDKLAPACSWHNRWIEEHADQIEEGRDALGRVVITILNPWQRKGDPKIEWNESSERGPDSGRINSGSH